jgi:hypothetical protein
MTKHAMSLHPIYHSWASMKSRCLSETNEDFHLYGGRGIGIHQPWVDDFWNFWDDMARGWRNGLSLDRIDVNGNYEPGNCRWATQQTQCRNRRDTVMLESPWGRIPLVEVADRLGVTPSTMHSRVRKGMKNIYLAGDGRRGS